MLTIIPKEILAGLSKIYKLLDIEQNLNKKDNNNKSNNLQISENKNSNIKSQKKQDDNK
jgi:hypothetical protein